MGSNRLSLLKRGRFNAADLDSRNRVLDVLGLLG
jgi:hypothetical protein